MIDKINEIIDEKEQYQLKALRLEAENTALKAILTKRDESVTEQTKIILNLEAENKRLKDIIKALKDTVIQWKKEYEILDSIIDMKDAVIAELKAENARLKEELTTYGATGVCEVCSDKANKLADKYLRYLQEIKKIAVMDICSNCITQKREDNCQCLADTILQLITKAEEE